MAYGGRAAWFCGTLIISKELVGLAITGVHRKEKYEVADERQDL